MNEHDDWEGFSVQRSYLDPRVWVPYSVGFGDQSHFLNAGSLRAVRAYVEEQLPGRTWHKVDEGSWDYR